MTKDTLIRPPFDSGWARRPRFIAHGPSILVVGPDRVGKTTIVQKLSELTEIPSFKCPAEKEIFKEGGRSSLAFDFTLTHFLRQTGYRFISDRAYPCEWVYASVFERRTDGPLLDRIDSLHAVEKTRILYLYSSVQPTEEDDLVPAEKYWDVKKTYDSFCEWTKCPVAAVDTAEMIAAFKNGGDTSLDVAKKCLKLMGMNEKGYPV